MAAVRKFLTGLSPRPPVPGQGSDSGPHAPDDGSAFARRTLATALGAADDADSGPVSVDVKRTTSTRNECKQRIEALREFLEAVLDWESVSTASTDDFVRGLDDGRFLLSVANRVAGQGHASSNASRLESIGIAGVSADNFDR